MGGEKMRNKGKAEAKKNQETRMRIIQPKALNKGGSKLHRRGDIPPSGSVMCLGLTDKVYLKRKDKKPAGHVFFFDVDKRLEMEDRGFFFYASMKHKAQFFVLETMAGFHVISFKVFRPHEYLKIWADFMERYPDTDYRYDVSNKILRLSEKGKSPKPEFVMCMGTTESGVSSAHVSAYAKAGIIRQEDVNGNMRKTFCRLMFYESKKRFR